MWELIATAAAALLAGLAARRARLNPLDTQPVEPASPAPGTPATPAPAPAVPVPPTVRMLDLLREAGSILWTLRFSGTPIPDGVRQAVPAMRQLLDQIDPPAPQPKQGA